MSTPRLRLWAITSMAALFALSGCTSLAPTCPSAADVQPEQLHGIWKVQLDGTGTDWSLQLELHPEHRGSLRGELTHGTQRHLVVADLDKGEFTLEESRDGVRIAATWLGKVQAGSCAQIINGTRQAGSGAEQRFEMRSERLR